MLLDARAPEYDPWLYTYCGELSNPGSVAIYLRHLDDRLKFGRIQPEGICVLDAGCGFGFTMVALAALGAAEVDGIEVHEPMVRTIRRYMCLLPDEVAIRIRPSHD